MSEHTPGLLALEEVASDSGHIKHLCPVDSEGMSLLTVVEHEGVKFAAVYSDDDARRFMACWNACDGISTESLVGGMALITAFQREQDRADAAERQSDSLRAGNAGLLEALEKALPFMEAESVISGYGLYRPSNPNDFHPDHESCSEDEIAAHKAACEAYDAGTYNDNYGGGWVGPGLHILKAPWGIGSYTDTIPELEAQCEKARAAIASARKQGDQG